MEKVDDVGGGSEVRILENSSYDTSLDVCKGPPTLEEIENPAAESSLSSDNYVSGSWNYCAKEMDDS